MLLLDEPCSALDPISTATIEELIVGLRESVAIVIVTHNLQQAFRVADHVGVHAPRRARRVRPQRAGLRPPRPAAHARLHQRGVRVRAAASLCPSGYARRARAHRHARPRRKRARSWKRSQSVKPTYARPDRRSRSESFDHAESRLVKVGATAVLHSSEGAAAAVTFATCPPPRCATSRSQITVKDAHGATSTRTTRRASPRRSCRPRCCPRTPLHLDRRPGAGLRGARERQREGSAKANRSPRRLRIWR